MRLSSHTAQASPAWAGRWCRDVLGCCRLGLMASMAVGVYEMVVLIAGSAVVHGQRLSAEGLPVAVNHCCHSSGDCGSWSACSRYSPHWGVRGEGSSMSILPLQCATLMVGNCMSLVFPCGFSA